MSGEDDLITMAAATAMVRDAVLKTLIGLREQCFVKSTSYVNHDDEEPIDTNDGPKLFSSSVILRTIDRSILRVPYGENK